MVNNLSAGENPLCQWQTASRSRGPRGIVAASRLSGTAVGVSRSRSLSARVVSACCDEVICDGFGSKRGEMRLEVPPQGSPDGPLAVNNALLSPIRSTSVSNLSSANVVGLPNHPRHASVPSNATLGKSFPGFSYHPRNASEPGPALLSAQFRLGVQTNANLNHQRHSSHVDNTTNPLPNVHLRSASVPKSMVTQKPGESVKLAPRIPSSTEVNAMMGMNDTVHRMAPQTRPALNVSNVNVNFYRAVPVNVVSAVPTIQCVNSSNDAGNNVSNVHIMPLNGTSQNVPIHVSSSVTLDNVVNTTPSASTSFSTGTTQVAVHTSQVPSYNVQVPTHSVQVPTSTNAQVQTPAIPPKKVPERTRTFTSTEAQTDEIAVCPSASTSEDPANKEQRRRERRERRHQRRVNTTSHNHSSETTPNFNCSSNERLPDILNSHLPPPYSPLPGNVPPSVSHSAVVPGGLIPAHVVPAPPPPGAIVQPLVPNVVPSTIVGNAILPFPPPVVPGQVPLVHQGAAPVPVTAASGFRFQFPATGFRR